MPGGAEEELPFGGGTAAWLDYFASVTGCKALVEEYLKLTHDYSSVRELYDPYDSKAVERMLLEMLLQKFRDLNGQTSPIEEDSSGDTDADDVMTAPLSLPVYMALTDKHFDMVTQVLSHAVENITKDKKAAQALTDQIINSRDDIVTLLLPKQSTQLAKADDEGESSPNESSSEPVAACHTKRGGDDAQAKQVLGLDFAPTNVPPHRRREMLACLFIFTMQLGSILLACVALYYWRKTWPFIIAYTTYVYIDTKYYARHIRPVSKFFRDSPLMKNFAKYFPVHLIRDEPASTSFSPKRSYMIGYHPHGILSIGAATAYGTDASGFDQKFPGITPRLCTLTVNTNMPFMREMILREGMIDSSARSIKQYLSVPGQAVVLVLGGAAEALDTKAGRYVLTIRRRKGFFRIAIQKGAPLVPSFGFGENDLWDTSLQPVSATSWVRRLQDWMYKKLTFSTPIFSGRGVFTYNFGMLPFRRPVYTVVGEPIEVAQKDHPTSDDIEALKERYITALRALFDKWKAGLLFMSSFADSPRTALEVAADATTDENDKENKTVDVMAAVHKLFTRMERQIEISQPANTIHYIVDTLCRYYPEHLHGFASIWSMDPDVQREKIDVVNFFRVNKMSAQIAAHFINAGYDTVETLESLTPDDLQDIEAFNDAKWLPGHKVRLVQLFSDIQDRVRQYKSDCTALIAPYMPRPPTVASVALPTPRVISTPAGPTSGLATSTQLMSSSFYGGYSSAPHPPQTARYISATAGPPSYVMSPGHSTRTTRVVTSSGILPYSARGSRMSTAVPSATGAWANTSRDISTTIIRSGPDSGAASIPFRMDLDPAQVRSLLLRQDEWSSGVMFDGDTGRIIASTAPLPGEADTSATTSLGSTPSEASNSTPLDYSRLAANVKGMIKAYSPADKGQAALSDGVDWLGMRFDVHAFYPPLLYGRQSLAEEGDDISPEMESTVGVAACNGLRNDVPIILVITYSLPVLSSRAVPQMIGFFREHRGIASDARRSTLVKVEKWMASDEKEEDAKGIGLRSQHTQSENNEIPANSLVEGGHRSVPSRTRGDAYEYQVKGEEALKGHAELASGYHSEVATKSS
ncbi:diacylglycerol O-acyltransferase 1 [Perkinsus olseni]|uniref:diacylglycerol O-acyltransferase n=1 Tax=Perkinsus olseni TaxID=32597 RepID=A0A7J6RV94_PEROL|nr:diacylglycerol O-acyltransferase 1 [Perkinsus olseni]